MGRTRPSPHAKCRVTGSLTASGSRIAAFNRDSADLILFLLDGQPESAHAVRVSEILIVVDHESVGEVILRSTMPAWMISTVPFR